MPKSALRWFHQRRPKRSTLTGALRFAASPAPGVVDVSMALSKAASWITGVVNVLDAHLGGCDAPSAKMTEDQRLQYHIVAELRRSVLAEWTKTGTSNGEPS